MIRILRTILKIDSQLGKNASQTAMRTRLIRALKGTLAFNSFRWRSIRMFNGLPKYLRNITLCSVYSFKTQLDSHLINIPDLPSHLDASKHIKGKVGRRQNQRLVLFYKIINGLAWVETEDILTPADSRTRKNHSLKLKHLQANCDSYRFSFFPATISSWNNLPFGIEKVDSVETRRLQIKAE